MPVKRKSAPWYVRLSRRPAKMRRVRRAIRPGLYKSSKMSLNVHRFSRYEQATRTLTLAAGANYNNGSMVFTLDTLVSPSEFTQLFDQYRLDKVVLQFKLHTNPYIVTSTATGNAISGYSGVTFPTLYVVNDHDSSTALTLAEFKQRTKTKRYVLQPNKIIRHVVKPAILNQLYRTVTTTGYAPKWKQFIDCANSDVPHYGLLWGLDYDGFTLPDDAEDQDLTVNCEVKYYFTCKDVR